MKNVMTTIAAAMALAAVQATQTAPPKKQPKADVGAGRVAWFDLTTKDLAKSKAFYGKLFGWTFDNGPMANLAVEIQANGVGIGTLRVAEGAISQWNGVVYVQVDDMPAACAKFKELGGTLAPGFPFDLSGDGGAVGLGTDPAGHPIGMYSRKPLAASKPEAK